MFKFFVSPLRVLLVGSLLVTSLDTQWSLLADRSNHAPLRDGLADAGYESSALLLPLLCAHHVLAQDRPITPGALYRTFVTYQQGSVSVTPIPLQSFETTTPLLKTRFEAFLNSRFEQWSRSEDPVLRRRAPLLRRAVIVPPAANTDYSTIPIQVTLARNSEGGLATFPGTGEASFQWVVNSGLWTRWFDELESGNSPAAEKQVLEDLMTSFLVKEISGVEFIQAYPDLMLSRAWVFTKLALEQRNSPARPFDRMRADPSYVEFVQVANALVRAPEAAGFIGQQQFLKSLGPEFPSRLDSLSLRLTGTPVTQAILDYHASMARNTVFKTESDGFWEQGLRHLRADFYNSQSQASNSFSLYVGRLALQAEILQGRARLDVNRQAIVEGDPSTLFFQRDFMGYLGDPAYYTVSPQRLAERFGRLPALSERELDQLQLDTAPLQDDPLGLVVVIPPDRANPVGLASGAQGAPRGEWSRWQALPWIIGLGVTVAAWFIQRRRLGHVPAKRVLVEVPRSILMIDPHHDVYAGLRGILLKDLPGLKKVLRKARNDKNRKPGERLMFRIAPGSTEESKILESLGFTPQLSTPPSDSQHGFVLTEHRGRDRFIKALMAIEDNDDRQDTRPKEVQAEDWRSWIMTEREYSMVGSKVKEPRKLVFENPNQEILADRLIPAPPATSQRQFSHRIQIQFDLAIGRRDIAPQALLEKLHLRGFVRYSINSTGIWSEGSAAHPDLALSQIECIGRTIEGNYLMAAIFDAPPEARSIRFSVGLRVNGHEAWVQTYKEGDAEVLFSIASDPVWDSGYVPEYLEFKWTGDVVFNPTRLVEGEKVYQRIRMSVQLGHHSYPVDTVTDAARVGLEAYVEDARGGLHPIESLQAVAQDLARNYILEGRIQVADLETPLAKVFVKNRHTIQEVKLTALQRAELAALTEARVTMMGVRPGRISRFSFHPLFLGYVMSGLTLSQCLTLAGVVAVWFLFRGELRGARAAPILSGELWTGRAA